MTSLLERAARAAHDFSEQCDIVDWELMRPETCKALARAVLGAVREPDDEMMKAVGCGAPHDQGIAASAWRTGFGRMIDAILSQEPK